LGSKTKLAIMASGKGTNAENLIIHAKKLAQVEIRVLLSDRLDAPVLDRARACGIKALAIPQESSRLEQEKKMLEVLKSEKIDWIFLAGYMKILSPEFLGHFHHSELNINKVVNVHPSLLPKFKGMNSYKRAFESGALESGVTIHFVDSGMDTGRVIYQESFPRKEGDDLQSFTERGKKLEYRLFKKALEDLASGTLGLSLNQAPILEDKNGQS
jgi:phosphoribosylglycinamide formyltransferase 1